MNNKGRGLVVVVLVLAAVCVIFLAAGYMMLNAWGGFEWWEKVPNTVKNVEEYQINDMEQTSISGYDKFEFSSISADMDIVYADTDTITVELKGSYRSGRGTVELKKETSGSKVHIYVDYPKNSGIFNWNETHLTITMPKDMEGEELTFNSVSGDVDIPGGLEADEIKIHTTSGDVQADDIQCEEFTYNNVSGELDLSGSVDGEIRVDTVSGDTEIAVSPGTDEININGVSGDVQIHISNSVDFRFSFNTVSGDFNCDFPVFTQGSRSDREGYTDTDADLLIDVDTVSGDLNIKD